MKKQGQNRDATFNLLKNLVERCGAMVNPLSVADLNLVMEYPELIEKIAAVLRQKERLPLSVVMEVGERFVRALKVEYDMEFERPFTQPTDAYRFFTDAADMRPPRYVTVEQVEEAFGFVYTKTERENLEQLPWRRHDLRTFGEHRWSIFPGHPAMTPEKMAERTGVTLRNLVPSEQDPKMWSHGLDVQWYCIGFVEPREFRSTWLPCSGYRVASVAETIAGMLLWKPVYGRWRWRDGLKSVVTVADGKGELTFHRDAQLIELGPSTYVKDDLYGALVPDGSPITSWLLSK